MLVVITVRVMVKVRWGIAKLLVGGHVFNSNNFVTSVTLAEVCALLSAVLVVVCFFAHVH